MVPLKRFITGGHFAAATFSRYLHRASLGQMLWGPRGKPKVVTVDDDIVKEILEKQWHGQRHRMPGAAEGKAKLNLPEETLQACRNEVRKSLTERMEKSLIEVKYCEPHLIWSMDIFERWNHGIKFHVLQVIDLGSRIKLDPAIKESAFTGDEVATHINMLMHVHGAPLFLKRDNGSNLNSSEVFTIMNLFGVIAFNSPPGCPQFNGVMERSQGEIKRYLNVMCKTESKNLDVFSSYVYTAIARSNRRKRHVLNDMYADQIWDLEYLHFSKREREAIYHEIKRIAAEILSDFPIPKQKRKDAVANAWRTAVRTWLEEKQYIKLYRDGKPLYNS